MPEGKARAVIEQELGGMPLEEVFEWIDLENVLGSASIAQVKLPPLSNQCAWSVACCFLQLSIWQDLR